MDNLLSYLKRQGWELKLGINSGTLEAPSKLEAYALLDTNFNDLAISVAKLRFEKLRLKWKGGKRPINVLASMTASEPDDETMLETAEEVLINDAANMALLQRVLVPGELRALTALESDDAIMASSALLRRIGQTPAEYCHDNMRRYFSLDLQEREEEPEYLATIKQELTQSSHAPNLIYQAWLNDASWCNFRTDFDFVYFQGLPCRLAFIHECDEIPVPMMV